MKFYGEVTYTYRGRTLKYSRTFEARSLYVAVHVLERKFKAQHESDCEIQETRVQGCG